MNLPFEVLQNIFKYLNCADLSHCQQICKKWSTPAQLALYSNVYLIHFQRSYLYIITITTSPNDLGSLLKHIDISQLPERYRESTLSFLDKFCPNLQTIRYCYTRPLFYDILLHELQNGHFQHLKSIPSLAYDFSDRESFDAVLSILRDNLENIHLEDVINITTTTTITDSLEKITTKLLEFISLNDLTVKKPFPKSISKLDALIESCPSLKKIRFVSKPSDNNSNDTLDLSLVRPRPDIDDFYGDFIYSDQSFKYFMKKFPNLKKMYLTSMSENTIYSKDVVMDFYKYALDITYACAHNIRMKDVYGFLISFFKNGGFTSIFKIGYSTDYYGSAIEPSTGICKNPIGTTEIELQYRSNLAMYKDNPLLPLLPHKEIIDQAADLIHHLELENFDRGGPYSKSHISNQAYQGLKEKLADIDYLTLKFRCSTFDYFLSDSHP